MASVSLLFFWGWALTPWRTRKPIRLRTAAMGLGEGPWSALSPCALSACKAACAVSRVEVDPESGLISRLWNYFFTPEVITEVCTELGLPHRTNGTFSGCIRALR